MVYLPRRVKQGLRIGASAVLVLFFAWTVFGQTRSQEVINAEQSGRVDSLDRRVSNIETTQPATIAVRLANLEEKVGDQQKLLYGILAAVIINLLTGGAKLPFSVKRRNDP